MRRVIFCLALALLPPAAVSDRPSYVGVGAIHWSFDESVDGVESEEARATGVRLTLTGPVAEHLSVEWHFATGGSDTVFVNTPLGSGDVEVEGELIGSMFLRPEVELGAVRLYGLAGYSIGRLEAEAGGVSVDGSDDGVSYGAGAEVEVADGTWLTADYVNYLRGDNYDFRAATVGMRFAF